MPRRRIDHDSIECCPGGFTESMEVRRQVEEEPMHFTPDYEIENEQQLIDHIMWTIRDYEYRHNRNKMGIVS